MSDWPRRHALEQFLAAHRSTPAPSDACVTVDPLCDFINLRGRSGDRSFRTAAEQVLEQTLPTDPNTCTRATQNVYWLGPDEWLIAGRGCARHAAGLEQALAGGFAAVNPHSGGLVRAELSGVAARDILHKGCTLDLDPSVFAPGQCAQTTLARSAVLIAPADSGTGYDLIVRRTFAEYLALWLAQAGAEHGICFVGET